MINLKITRPKQKLIVGESDAPKEEYPYELKISFNKKILNKLGLSVDDFDIGETVNFNAKGKVTDLSKRQSEYDPSEKENVSIQITDIALPGMKDKIAAQVSRRARSV